MIKSILGDMDVVTYYRGSIWYRSLEYTRLTIKSYNHQVRLTTK
ncbi:hypothetical protein [Muricomes intestini]|jgi:hypothetical protein